MNTGRVRYGLIWAAISLAIGLACHLAFDIDFVLATLIAAAALTLNGIVAFREDRGKFND